jgi:ADA HAT complex component 1
MYRFWSSVSRGCDKSLQVEPPLVDLGKIQPIVIPSNIIANTPSRPPKRRRQSNAAIAPQPIANPPAHKRPRLGEVEHDEQGVGADMKMSVTTVEDERISASNTHAPDLDSAREAIDSQLSLEILLKHDELRLINQELGKCQAALEQLRRCHLIPYPVNVPTPDQMMNVAGGQGPALQAKLGEKVPQWAPPFGVTDGPYARHYAKWLIPDAKFDGLLPDAPLRADVTRSRTSLDGRSTRNGLFDSGLNHNRGRPVRGTAGQKLQSLSSGYTQPKGQAGPCILKRADGQTVKLVCNNCHRENFSSTQGFINHCRIAHKQEFKSHEEAAVHCGHPVDAPEPNSVAVVTEEKPTAKPLPSASGVVHPLAHANAMAIDEACFSVLRRIEQSMELFRKGKLEGVSSIPGVSEATPKKPMPTKKSSNLKPSAESPYLSRLLQSRGFTGDLGNLVKDAKTKDDLEDVSSPEEEFDSADIDPMQNIQSVGGRSEAFAPRMRVPAGSTMSPATATNRPQSSKGLMPLMSIPQCPSASTPRAMPVTEPETVGDEDMMDVDLSPNTAVSNNAPSLVSDDGEYDDSVADSDSESEVNDSLEPHPLPEVDEIHIDDCHAGSGHHRGSTGGGPGTTVRLRKDDGCNHVTFVSPVKNDGNDTQRRGRQMAARPNH